MFAFNSSHSRSMFCSWPSPRAERSWCKARKPSSSPGTSITVKLDGDGPVHNYTIIAVRRTTRRTQVAKRACDKHLASAQINRKHLSVAGLMLRQRSAVIGPLTMACDANESMPLVSPLAYPPDEGCSNRWCSVHCQQEPLP